MSKRLRWLAFTCPHVPLHDKAAVRFMLSELKAHKPNVVVCLGDLFEADSASRWPSEYDWTLADEYLAANELLHAIRDAAPQAKRVFLPGNHDDNLLALGRIPSKVRGLTDWRVRQYDAEDRFLNEELFLHWQKPAEYVYDRRRGVYRLGQVTFAHGYETGRRGDENQAAYLGEDFGLTVLGHTHRPVPVSRVHFSPAIPLNRWFANAGTLRDIQAVPYMARKNRSRWGQAVVVGEAAILKSPRRSREWDAELKVFRMFDDAEVAA